LKGARDLLITQRETKVVGAMSKQYISASKIAQFLYCPFTFELAAAGYEPVEPYLPAVATGTAFHTAFRYMYVGDSPESAAEAAIAVTEMTTGHSIDVKEREALLRRLRALPKWILEADDVEVRLEKEIPGTEIVVTGYMDAVVGDKIIDLKAVSKMKYELPPTYQIQAQIYMYMADKGVTSFIMLGPKGEVAEFEVDRMPSEVVGEMLEYFVYSMEQHYRPPSGLTNFACNKCSFQHVCPFYKLLKQTPKRR
jgi:CRISPR/Cas system-associated exonuclease Cas4 (RecB family)